MGKQVGSHGVPQSSSTGENIDLEPLHPTVVPPGYPREYERRLMLRDGRSVWVRPIIPADAPHLADAIMSANADTLRGRFLGGAPRVTPALLTHWTALDYVRRFALGAADPVTSRGIAVARYEPLDEGVAEIAVVVDPAWRRLVLATALIELLAEAALERGIHAFAATYLAENRPVAALLDLAGAAGRQRIRQGIAEVMVELDRERIGDAVRGLEDGRDGA